MWSFLVNVPGELGSLLGRSVVRTWYFQCQRSGFNPRLGTKIPQDTWHDQKFKNKKFQVSLKRMYTWLWLDEIVHVSSISR